MSKYVLTIALVIASACAAFAQETTANGSASATGNVAAEGRAVNLGAGTRVMAQLQNTLDVRRAKVGDQVLLKTTEAIKSQGRTIVNKGARLIGRVTEVSQRTRANGESSVGLIFDRLESGSLEAPISATITSVTQAATRTKVNNEGVSSEGRARSSGSARTSSRQGSNGGLLGGVAGTVGGVLNTTTQTAGDVVGGTTGAVGGAVGSVTEGVGGIRISQSTDASIEGGTTLSLTGDNLRLEKGTSLGLRLNQATSVGRDN
ncbi:MAG TPA: hypothetical protein VJT09_17935 [Pyrinomonadaceae bacterium]|nr:hypothetical protein [Pyrinomonadaceae bacterium]